MATLSYEATLERMKALLNARWSAWGKLCDMKSARDIICMEEFGIEKNATMPETRFLENWCEMLRATMKANKKLFDEIAFLAESFIRDGEELRGSAVIPFEFLRKLLDGEQCFWLLDYDADKDKEFTSWALSRPGASMELCGWSVK